VRTELLADSVVQTLGDRIMRGRGRAQTSQGAQQPTPNRARGGALRSRCDGLGDQLPLRRAVAHGDATLIPSDH
jgi:hypothetical protein